MDQDSQVPLVHLVRVSSCVEEISQSPDLGGENSNLDLAASSVGADSRLFLELVLWLHRVGQSGLWCEVFVGVVATECGNAALDVDAQSVF